MFHAMPAFVRALGAAFSPHGCWQCKVRRFGFLAFLFCSFCKFDSARVCASEMLKENVESCLRVVDIVPWHYVAICWLSWEGCKDKLGFTKRIASLAHSVWALKDEAAIEPDSDGLDITLFTGTSAYVT